MFDEGSTYLHEHVKNHSNGLAGNLDPFLKHSPCLSLGQALNLQLSKNLPCLLYTSDAADEEFAV